MPAWKKTMPPPRSLRVKAQHFCTLMLMISAARWPQPKAQRSPCRSVQLSMAPESSALRTRWDTGLSLPSRERRKLEFLRGMQGFGIAVIAEIARNRRNRALFPQRYEANRQTGLKFALRMKSLFAGYYRPTPDEFNELWKNCIFVFDASVLLDLYRSTAKTRDVVLSILS